MSERRGRPVRGEPARRKPPLSVFPTTLWSYPSQHYGEGMQGDKAYVGATPSWVIWQLLQRYTREGDLVVDPMCGSGTTIDVARDLNRKALGYDLAPPEARKGDVFRSDARSLPLENGVADFAFVDPPYSTHVDYSDDAACIGRLDASEPDERGTPGGAYYDAMRAVIGELHRVLKDRRYMALYVSDSFQKRKGQRASESFMPIGFELFAIMRELFTPIDIVCVVRRNEKLERGNWRRAAVQENFFLRGFNYCFIMKKDESARRAAEQPGRRGGRR